MIVNLNTDRACQIEILEPDFINKQGLAHFLHWWKANGPGDVMEDHVRKEERRNQIPFIYMLGRSLLVRPCLRNYCFKELERQMLWRKRLGESIPAHLWEKDRTKVVCKQIWISLPSEVKQDGPVEDKTVTGDSLTQDRLLPVYLVSSWCEVPSWGCHLLRERSLVRILTPSP